MATMEDIERQVKKLEARMGDFDKLTSLLKDEVGGLRASIGGLLAADREKLSALEGHHQAYAAAAQRAELAELRASRATQRTDQLETEIHKLEAEVLALRTKGE